MPRKSSVPMRRSRRNAYKAIQETLGEESEDSDSFRSAATDENVTDYQLEYSSRVDDRMPPPASTRVPQRRGGGVVTGRSPRMTERRGEMQRSEGFETQNTPSPQRRNGRLYERPERSERSYQEARNRSPARSERSYEAARSRSTERSGRSYQGARYRSPQRSERSYEGARNRSLERSEGSHQGARYRSPERSERSYQGARNRSPERGERSYQGARYRSPERSQRSYQAARNGSLERSERISETQSTQYSPRRRAGSRGRSRAQSPRESERAYRDQSTRNIQVGERTTSEVQRSSRSRLESRHEEVPSTSRQRVQGYPERERSAKEQTSRNSQVRGATPSENSRSRLESRSENVEPSNPRKAPQKPAEGTRRKATKPKKHVLKEIRKYQKSVDLLIPRLPFSRVVREVMYSFAEMRITASALAALQESAEMYITELFADAYRCTFHRGRVTLVLKDIELVRYLRGRYDVF